MKTELKEFLGKNIKYDSYGQYIWAVRKDGHHQKIADLRGWGAIQNLFKMPNGQILEDEAVKFQDELGQFIVDAIKEKLDKSTLI